MSTDRNVFDSWLKDKLYRDILFRAVLWSAISVVTLFIAVHERDVNAYQFFENVASTIKIALDSVGTLAIVLAFVAMLFKDLEFVEPRRYGQGSRLGRLGGVIRRTAGDLTLWILASLTSIISAAVFSTLSELASGMITASEALALGLIYIPIALMFAVAAFLNYLVRRESPPISEHEKTPYWLKKPLPLFIVYGLAVMLLVVVITCY